MRTRSTTEHTKEYAAPIAKRSGSTDRRFRHGCAPYRSNGRQATREYRSWSEAKARCYNPRQKSFALYGARGITMCPEWREDFLRFLADMGPRPIGTSLDRYPDNDGPYAPGNCRWASRGEQSRNTRRNKWLTFNGETLCVAEWAHRIGIPNVTLWNRLYRFGWSIEKSLTAPVLRARIPTCHPERPHDGRGLCGPCYYLAWLKPARTRRAYERRSHA